MATIKDVAEYAQVSTATVSHVMNNTRVVMPETRRAVLDAVKALNYSPNAIARGLSRNATQTIGVVIADITSPFFAKLLRHVELAVSAKGFSLILCNTYENPERELASLRALQEQRVDGILITPTGRQQDIYRHFEDTSTPIVYVDRLPAGAPGSFVGTDNLKSALEATRYLVGLGHERIALLVSRNRTSAMDARIDGYRQALQEHGLSAERHDIAECSDDVTSAADAARAVMERDEPPTALIAGSHFATVGALAACRDLALKIPDDLSMVCFDNSSWTQVMNPPLTAVQKPIEQLGHLAVETLLASIAMKQLRQKNHEAPSPLSTSHVLVEASLVVRGSCRPLASVPTPEHA